MRRYVPVHSTLKTRKFFLISLGVVELPRYISLQDIKRFLFEEKLPLEGVEFVMVHRFDKKGRLTAQGKKFQVSSIISN